MRGEYEHTSESESFDWLFDRETLGAVLFRHPWAVRFLVAELVLVSLAGIIPLFGESEMTYLLFGILLSLAFLGGVAASLVGAALAVRRGIHEVRYGGGIWPR